MPRPATRGLSLNYSLTVLTIAVSILFGFLNLVNLLKVRYYHFYSLNLVNITFFSPLIDWWIWFISLLLMIVGILVMVVAYHLSLPRWMIMPYSLLLASFTVFLFDSQVANLLTIPLGFTTAGLSIYYGKGFLISTRGETATLISTGIIALLIPAELASLSSWLINPFDYEIPFKPSPRWRFPIFDLNLFNILYPLTSWLLMILLYCGIWIPISKHISSRIRKNHPKSTQVTEVQEKQLLTIGLLVTLAVAVFVAYYPYIHLPPRTLVGVDSIYYHDYLNRMIEQGPQIAFTSDRPAFRLLLYYIKLATMQPSYIVIRIMPAICTLGLALATFLLVKTGTGNVHQALLSSIFSVFSIQTTTGMYAYILASWFTIIEIMLAFTFLLKSLEKHSAIHSLISGLILIIALPTHPYTWLMMIIVLVCYITLTILARSEKRKDIFLSLTPILIASLAFVAAAIFIYLDTRSFWRLLDSMWNTVRSSLEISKIASLQPSLFLMVQRWAGGGFGNPLIIALAVSGMVSMADLTKRFNRLILCWITVPSLVILALVPTSEWIYWRIAFVIPFHILAAIGLHWLLNWLRRRFDSNAGATMTTFRLFRILLITFIILLLFNYTLRTVDEAMIHMA